MAPGGGDRWRRGLDLMSGFHYRRRGLRGFVSLQWLAM